MNTKNLPFILLTLSIFIILLVAILLQDGMFMDGLQYSCVAKNMANGKGSFWQPFFSATWWKSNSNVFAEQPPLGLWIQSIFFRLLGESLYVERFYSLLTASLNAILIVLNWKLWFKNNDEIKRMFWMPVLLWITIPVCFWSFQNNMLENTLSGFTLAAVYFSLRALLLKPGITPNLVLSGLFVFAATLTKGLPGLFPLVVIPLYWLFFKNISFGKAFRYSALVCSIPVILYALLLLNAEASQSLRFYFFERLLYRISEDPTSYSRFDTLFRLSTELLPILILVGLIWFISILKKQKLVSDRQSLLQGLFFISIGLSASLPLMLTLVQKGFYFVPALPLLGIGFSIILSKPIMELIRKINGNKMAYKILLACSVLILTASIVFSASKTGGFSRDEDVLHDVYLFGKIIPKGDIIKVEDEIYDEWSFQLYLNRYFDISISPSDKFHYHYYIKKKSSPPPDEAIAKKIDLSTRNYELYKVDFQAIHN